MFARLVLEILSFCRVAGPMALVYLVANAGIILSSSSPAQRLPVVMLFFTAFKLASLPRDKFVEKREPWSAASIGSERLLIAVAISLHIASCLATLAAAWFFWPSSRYDIPLTAGAAIVAAVTMGAWKWFDARRSWSEYGVWTES